MTIERRVQRLEGVRGAFEPALNLIIISLVAPGANGQVNLGPYSAHILTGNYAGTEILCADDETAEAFKARCDALLQWTP